MVLDQIVMMWRVQVLVRPLMGLAKCLFRPGNGPVPREATSVIVVLALLACNWNNLIYNMLSELFKRAIAYKHSSRLNASLTYSHCKLCPSHLRSVSGIILKLELHYTHKSEREKFKAGGDPGI